MSKRKFVTVASNGKIRRIFIDDIVKIHNYKKKARPQPPRYIEGDLHSIDLKG